LKAVEDFLHGIKGYPKEIIDYNSIVQEDQKRQFIENKDNDQINRAKFTEAMDLMHTDFETIVVRNTEIQDLQVFIEKIQTLEKAKKLLFGGSLIQFDDLMNVLRDFDELGFKDCNAYKILLIMKKVHIAWTRDVE